MSQDELRDVLLEAIEDENLVDEFFDRVEKANEAAQTRIARANTTVESTDEEAPADEAVDEEVVVDEAIEDDVEEIEEEIEEEEEEIEEEDLEIVLDETFVHDLATSQEFVDAVRTAVEHVLDGFKNDLENRFRAIEEEQEQEREWTQDKPVRTKRAVYRPREKADVNTTAVVVKNTLEETANDSLDEIFS